MNFDVRIDYMVVRFLEKFYSTAPRRFVILFVLPFLITLLFFSYIKIISQFKEGVKREGVEISFFQDSQNRLEEIKNNVAWLGRIPDFAFRFNSYASNNVESRTGDKKLISLLNIDIGGKYIGGIKYKTTGLLLSDQDISALSKSITSGSIVRSVNYQDYDDKKLGPPEIKIGSSYSIFILPTLNCFLFVYLLIITLVYAFVIILSSWLKFILLGDPLLKVTKEYQNRKF